MKKYKFKLQTLLNIKEQMESNIKNELGAEITHLNREKKLLNSYINKKELYVENSVKKNTGIINISQVILYNNYIKGLCQKIKEQKNCVNKTQYNIDKIRERLIVTSKEKQMLQKLDEKEFENFKYNNIIEEQKINDEVLSFKHSKK